MKDTTASSKVNYFLCQSFAAFISSVLCTLLSCRSEHEKAIGVCHENEGLCHENAEVPLSNSVPHTTRNNCDFLVRP